MDITPEVVALTLFSVSAVLGLVAAEIYTRRRK